MSEALIGHTGFVGGNLARQHRFDEFFNSTNIESIAGREFDLLVCSGMPAAKWLANLDPEGDARVLNRLLRCLDQVRAHCVVVISTVDVYPDPVGVDESTPIDPVRQHPYGRNRLVLERTAQATFPQVYVVRLPALFGQGLRKNAIYDLLHDNETHKIHADSSFQFYNLHRLWPDIQRTTATGIGLVNFATEPITMADVARTAFGMDFNNRPAAAPVRYDFHSRHSAAFGGSGDYLYRSDQVLSEMAVFVARERGRL